MSILKTVGILLTVASAFTINMSLIKQIKNRTHALRQVYLMIDYIEISVKYQNTDIREIFKSLSKNEKFLLLPFIDDFIKDDFALDFSEYDFKNFMCRNIFSAYSCELLNGYFSMLGKSDTDGQILNCRTYKEFFKVEIEKAEKNEDVKIKTAVSVVFGIAFSVLIIIM